MWKVLHGHYKTIAVTPTLRASSPFAIELMDRTMNSPRFQAYVADVLVPALKTGNTMVMDTVFLRTGWREDVPGIATGLDDSVVGVEHAGSAAGAELIVAVIRRC